MRNAATLFSLSATFSIFIHTHQTNAITYNVVSDPSSASSTESDVYGLSDALEVAVAGDTISLADGTYTEQIASSASGKEGNPITITGGRDAVIKSSSPSVEINHSWITLKGFSVDGEADDEDDYDSYTNKCVVVDGQGESEDEALEGFVMTDVLVQNCGGECVRLKNFVVNAEITGNEIYHCGVYDFQGDGEGSNGEGLYIGTSYNQWEDYGADNCNGNWVADNTIATYGNECVEVKEGSSYNIIEYNVCSNQEDSESGCFCSRGDDNAFRYNDASDCVGAGIRLGGWADDDGHLHGQNNDVHDNTFDNTQAGALAVRVVPQGQVCGNACEDGPCNIESDEDEDEDVTGIEDSWDVSCDGTSSSPPPIISGTPSPVSETASPVLRTPSPTSKTPSPVAYTPSPESETPWPINSTPSPVLETPYPVPSTPSPIDETQSSAPSTPSPTSEAPFHVDDGGDNEHDNDDDDGTDDNTSDDDDDDNDDEEYDENDDDDDDDDDDDGGDDANDDYQTVDEDDDDADDDGNDDDETDNDVNDNYESDDDDPINDDYQSDDDDGGDDDNDDDGSGDDDAIDDDNSGGDDDGDNDSVNDDNTNDRRGRRRGGRE